MLDLVSRTASGNPPPTAFLVTLWVLTVVFALVAIVGAGMGVRFHRAGVPGKAGCLFTVAVPAALLAAFFISWIVGIS